MKTIKKILATSFALCMTIVVANGMRKNTDETTADSVDKSTLCPYRLKRTVSRQLNPATENRILCDNYLIAIKRHRKRIIEITAELAQLESSQLEADITDQYDLVEERENLNKMILEAQYEIRELGGNINAEAPRINPNHFN